LPHNLYFKEIDFLPFLFFFIDKEKLYLINYTRFVGFFD